jgi:hypothetical protein
VQVGRRGPDPVQGPRHLYRTDKQFSKRDRRENIIVEAEKGSGVAELIFGVFPTQRSVGYIAQGYQDTFQPTKLRANPPSRRLLDFRPVIRNRAAMGWIVGHTVHTWELSALRAWGVTFLAAGCASEGAPRWLPDPTVLFTVAGLAGIAVSITGNETAQRWGWERVVTVAMSTAVVLSLLTGWSATVLAVLAAALVVLWNAAIYFDSSALTAGTVQASDKELRGATMGLHSMCGYAGGFIGPLGVGLVLDWAGNADGWGLAFGHLALVTLTGLLVLRRLGARSAMPTVAASSA